MATVMMAAPIILTLFWSPYGIGQTIDKLYSPYNGSIIKIVKKKLN